MTMLPIQPPPPPPYRPEIVSRGWQPRSQEDMAALRASIQRADRIADRIASACLILIGLIMGCAIGFLL